MSRPPSFTPFQIVTRLNQLCFRYEAAFDSNCLRVIDLFSLRLERNHFRAKHNNQRQQKNNIITKAKVI